MTGNIRYSVGNPVRTVKGMAALIGLIGLGGLAFMPAAFASSAGPPANSTPQAQADAVIQPSLVYIAIQATDVVQVPWATGALNYNVTVNASCSGSVVDPAGIILTAGHCADPAEFETFAIDNLYQQLITNGKLDTSYTQSQAENNWQTGTPQLAFKVYSLATVKRVADAIPLVASLMTGSDRPLAQGDVALLQVNPASPLPAVQIATANPDSGTNLEATGFPGDITGLVDIGSLQPTLSPGQVTSNQAVNANPFIGVSSTESPGMSGGPVISVPDGAVYGTVSWGPGDPNAQQLNFATGTRTVQEELSQFHVAPTLDTADKAWRTGLADYFAGKYREAIPQFNAVLVSMPSDVWAQQYLGLSKQSVPQEPAAVVKAKPGSSSTGLFIGIGAGVVVLLLIGGGVLLMRRRQVTAVPVVTVENVGLPPVQQADIRTNCSKCGAPSSQEDRFCPSCGQVKEEQ